MKILIVLAGVGLIIGSGFLLVFLGDLYWDWKDKREDRKKWEYLEEQQSIGKRRG